MDRIQILRSLPHERRSLSFPWPLYHGEVERSMPSRRNITFQVGRCRQEAKWWESYLPTPSFPYTCDFVLFVSEGIPDRHTVHMKQTTWQRACFIYFFIWMNNKLYFSFIYEQWYHLFTSLSINPKWLKIHILRSEFNFFFLQHFLGPHSWNSWI